jgi:pimeloyl-ACP methyl ester carboxylesterase
MAQITHVSTKDGIIWYCEQQGSGPHVILIPSGEGDCSCFAKVAGILSRSFTVTTFDMPGFSRSIAPEIALHGVTASLLASQIVGLMDELSIDEATFYGSSSGGLAALALVTDYPGRVRNAIVHEVPLGTSAQIESLTKLDDGTIVDICRNIFANSMNEDTEAWEALGEEYHARLEKNYVVWVRKYADSSLTKSLDQSRIGQKPVDWTIGALTVAGTFFNNVTTACNAGIPIGLLPSKHFPQVSIPDILAEHIQITAVKHLEASGNA